jgi:hypothetical protein
VRLLFLFLDGVGLGADNPGENPLAATQLPVVETLLEGGKLVAGQAPIETQQATLLELDACLNVPGIPQSASGQATLLTGINVPALLGEHYGPKPNRPIQAILENGNLFTTLKRAGKKCGLLNAFPPGYFQFLDSGRRLPGAIAMAALHAGLKLKTRQDLMEGKAFSADFTGIGWREVLGFDDAPLMNPREAGEKLAWIARDYDFAMFEHWSTDVAGHRQDPDEAKEILITLDSVLGGLTEQWQNKEGLILITSDHGNIETMDSRRHTTNPVPCLLIGDLELRRKFSQDLHNLAGIYPAILRLLLQPEEVD